MKINKMRKQFILFLLLVTAAGSAFAQTSTMTDDQVMSLVVIGFNSLGLLPESIVDWINQLDTFLLTMAMAALGAETSFDKFKKAGIKPFLLAAILYCWLIGGGYCLVKFAIPYLQ